ncbi:MAG: helix-turn-helix domain-containing protein [Polyangiales bacterium]
MLGGKWRAVILARLKDSGGLRYADLRRLVPGMSEKMLTQRLRELCDDGLVERGAGGAYALTARGESAREVLRALHAWGVTLAPEMDARVVAPAAVGARGEE